jgi:hypothetical protein
MLWFERQVVAALSRDAEPSQHAAIESYVDGALRAMPEHIRWGVAAESVALGAWARADAFRRRHKPHGTHQGDGPRLEPLDRSPIAPVRQYVRLLRSLVIFAQYEQPEATA